MNLATDLGSVNDTPGVNQRLYHLDPPFQTKVWDFGACDYVPCALSYVVVSAVIIPTTGPEVLIFPALGNGITSSSVELRPGSQRGTLDHATALRDMGYEIVPEAKPQEETKPMFEPMPEVTKLIYVATYENIIPGFDDFNAPDVEYPDSMYSDFLKRFETALQPIFPNAELWLHLDGAQYTSIGDCIETDGSEESADEFRDLEDYALYTVCAHVAGIVASEVFPDPADFEPDAQDDMSDVPMPHELADDEKYGYSQRDEDEAVYQAMIGQSFR